MKRNTNAPNSTDTLTHSIEAATERDRQKILILLREQPTHTITFREFYGLISPAPRIKELRVRGYNIRTRLIRAVSQDGRLHRNIALYTLISEPTMNKGS